MTQTRIQKSFAPFKKLFPGWIWKPVRSIGTAFIAPVLAAHRTGFFRSTLKMTAVSKHGEPIPWYTYPSIDFLKHRTYEGRKILEFGGGQSTLWWAKRAKLVVTLEGDKNWYERIKDKAPENVDLCLVSMESREINVSQVKDCLQNKGHSKYDVIVIDGLYRYGMIDIALSYLNDDGIIVCDNAEGYGFHDGFKECELCRVDFFGNAPGVVLPHSTSIYFGPSSFAFDAKHPIPVIAKEL